MANTLQEARTRVKSGALDQYLCLGSHPQPGTLQHPAILFFLFLQLSSSCRTLVSFICCPSPLLTCSPARYLAARPWWTAPSGSTGPRSLVGPSAGGSHTTATDEEAVAGPLPWATQGWRVASQPGGPKRPRRGWGTGQRVGTTEISRKIQQWLLTISIQTLVVRASSRSFWGTEDRAKFPYLPSPGPWCPSTAPHAPSSPGR